MPRKKLNESERRVRISIKKATLDRINALQITSIDEYIDALSTKRFIEYIISGLTQDQIDAIKAEFNKSETSNQNEPQI